jgi:hypothetical protein
MTMLKKLFCLSLIITALFTIGCYNNSFIKPTQADIDAYVKIHPDLPELDKACIYDGRFEVGMLQETVRFLLGEPKDIETIQQPWAQQEKWWYKQGNKKVFYMEDNGVVGIEEL